MTAAMMVAVLASYNKRDLSDIIDELPVYHLVKGKHPAPDPAALVRAVEEAFFRRDHREDRRHPRLIRDDAWALVRASGTEPMTQDHRSSQRSPGVARYHVPGDHARWSGTPDSLPAKPLRTGEVDPTLSVLFTAARRALTFPYNLCICGELSKFH